MIQTGKIHRCDACGTPRVGMGENGEHPEGLHGGKGAARGIVGTVDVPNEDGKTFTTRPFYAHRMSCVRQAVQNVLDGVRPPLPGDDDQ